MKTRMFIETIRGDSYWDQNDGNTTLSPFHQTLYVPEPYADGPRPVEVHVIDLTDDEWRPGCL